VTGVLFRLERPSFARNPMAANDDDPPDSETAGLTADVDAPKKVSPEALREYFAPPRDDEAALPGRLSTMTAI